MIKIGKHFIGKGRTYIIAEAGINHNGDIKIAKDLIKAAYEAGADAVKFQSFRASVMCDLSLLETKNVAALTNGSQSSYKMYKALELSKEDHKILFDYAEEIGIACFSSVFDLETIELITALNVPAIKISSGDITFLPLIEKAGETGIPLIVSTGMATQSEVTSCYEFMKKKNFEFVLMHCVSEYPVSPENVNLNVISSFKNLFNVPIGFSDHSKGMHLPIAAVALKADVIEKHFTLSNEMDGPDQKLSLNPTDFSKMVDSIRDVEKALGKNLKEPTMNEWKDRTNGRRGIKLAVSCKAGEIITYEKLKITKPEKGLKPKFLKDILGKKLNRDLDAGTPLDFKLIE